MTDANPKTDPDDLSLRVPPRQVTRIDRRVLILIVGGLGFVILATAMLALDPPSLETLPDSGTELYNITNKPMPEGLQDLPARYSDLPPPEVKLGPPLPGDLGGAIIETERELGIAQPDLPFRPDPAADALRAERIRQARLEIQAHESGLFFERTGLTARETIPTNAMPVPSALSEVAVPPIPDQALGGVDDQNRQGRKLEFVHQDVDPTIYNSHALQEPVSPYLIMAGTVIAASLVTGINSDLPGQVIAQVTEHVYDSVTGRHLLIPQGSRLIGSYDSVIAFGQSRALLVWRRIIRPDGSSLVIENLPATDPVGYAGLADEIDFHTWRLIKGVALSTLLGVGTELTFGDDESDLIKAIRESSQENAHQAGQRITERNLNIQPTITVRTGWPLRVIVNKDLVLQSYRETRR